MKSHLDGTSGWIDLVSMVEDGVAVSEVENGHTHRTIEAAVDVFDTLLEFGAEVALFFG